MFSIAAYSQFAYSDAPSTDSIPPALKRLATAQTANPIVFIEVTARENNVTILEDILSSRPGAIIQPYSGLPYSALNVPRIERQTTRFLFATRPWIGAPDDVERANQRAIPRLITGGRLSVRAPMEATDPRRGQRTIGDARIANADGALDYIIENFTLQGGKIRAWIAEPTDNSDQWALFYEATIESVEASRSEIILNITTIADQLKRSLQTRKYTGGGGLSGDAAVAGRLVPTLWGEAEWIDPVLISEADRIYQIHDGPIQSVDWVREGGLDYDFTADFADFPNLQLATLASGEYATCRARGLIRIGTALEGLVYPLRVGAKGDARGNGYVSATGDILYRIARDRAFLRADQVDTAAFLALPRSRVGFYTNGSQDFSVEAVFDALLGGVIGTYGVGRDAQLTVRRLIPADFLLDNLQINPNQILGSRVEVPPYTPKTRQTYTYNVTWAPVSEDQISPEADGSTAKAATTESLEGEVFKVTTAAIPPFAVVPIRTYFLDQGPAENVAEDALLFSQRNPVPLQTELGRIGLLTDIGRVIAIENARFATDFRGVVYEQEINLGAAITSKLTAYG
jgi:hypothetical protein